MGEAANGTDSFEDLVRERDSITATRATIVGAAHAAYNAAMDELRSRCRHYVRGQALECAACGDQLSLHAPGVFRF